MSNSRSERPGALVTGASSGLGAAFAERLAQDGYDLVIVARRRDRLESLAGQLHANHQVNVEVIAADLSEPGDLSTVEKHISQNKALELLVNNAGFGGYMPFVELDPDQATELINLKVLAVTRLTRAALPGMLERGRGSIVNVSSRLAFSAALGSAQLPKRAVYAGANAFINTFSQLLQGELEGTGVQVQALCPGVVETEFHERVGIEPGRYPAAIVMKPEKVVEASLTGLKLGEVICVPPLEDLALLTQIQEDEKRFFELSRGGTLATRYRT
jgi:short-subunit dehydrogenase